jgi:dihydrofolate reductase
VIISLLVAMDEQQGIGKAGGLPWHISSDLRRFKALTMGHHIIMGRKTWESIAKPLPGRKMVVISRDSEYTAEGCTVVHSLKHALQLARKAGEEEAFVIGGGQIFTLALPDADKIFLTRVEATTSADTYFPTFDPSEWTIIHQQAFPASEKDQYASEFCIMVRNTVWERANEESTTEHSADFLSKLSYLT